MRRTRRPSAIARSRAVRCGMLTLAVLLGVSSDAVLPVDAAAAPAAPLDRGAASSPSESGASAGSELARLRPGNIYQARIAVRRACRRFYGYGTQAQVDRQCGRNPIGWRSDCYADRPSHFVPRDGGCAYLRGYFAVYFLAAGEPSPAYRPTLFRVGRTRWRVQPESD